MSTLLTPEMLGRFRTLDLVARYLVEGFIAGLHRSPYHGFSVEFSEHRPYQQGDDVRHIDWRLWARTGRYHVKQYEEETNLRAWVLLDSSASMDFASGAISKFRWGSLLAAALMYLMIRQQDAAGLVLFDEKMRLKMPPRAVRGYLNTLFGALESARPSGSTAMATTLHQMADSLKKRGLVVLISDLLDDEDQVLQGLKHFRHTGHEVLVFHLMDPAELDFSRMSGGRFRDMESGERISADPRLVAEAVNRRTQAFVTRMKQRCHAESIDYIGVDISRDIDRVLLEYLIKRKRMA